jgi:hypothetical protein
MLLNPSNELALPAIAGEAPGSQAPGYDDDCGYSTEPFRGLLVISTSNYGHLMKKDNKVKRDDYSGGTLSSAAGDSEFSLPLIDAESPGHRHRYQ